MVTILRTDKEIIEQTNRIAIRFYSEMGYKIAKENSKFEMRKSKHPTEKLCWELACIAQDMLRETDVNDAIMNTE